MKLLVVIPVFNEQDSIKKVYDEWNSEIKKFKIDYKILIINDGSTDNTQNIIKNIRKKNLIISNNKNIGHGRSCVFGYLYSIKKNFTHVLQIDGDGQCDPKYFKYLLKNINHNAAIYGYRAYRNDGAYRKLFSRVMEILILIKTLRFVKDPNSPYRLINIQLLKKVVKKIPTNVMLANVYLTLEISKISKIFYVPITFNKRYFGKSKYNFLSMFKSLLNLLINI